MPRSRFVNDLLESLFAGARWRRGARNEREAAESGDSALPLRLAQQLLAERSQASGIATAQRLLDAYGALDIAAKGDFLDALAERFGADPAAIGRALEAYHAAPSAAALGHVGKAAEPPRQELLRRLNQAPNATAALVAMRADLLRLMRNRPALSAFDADFVHLLYSWFNLGFLVLRRIDWSSPAELLERIIRYEAVHSIATWEELRARLLPADRRCYGFFHPAMGDEPLIFVEVALTDAIPASIQSLLAPDRPVIAADRARVATFYSISNCQPGLAGISFGQFLIKQVVDDLKREFSGLETFVTLSPVPDFMAWLKSAAARGDAAAAVSLADGDPGESWGADDPRRHARMALAARYFLAERDQRGRLIDPVARFHIGNGAMLEHLCWLGDTSPRGMAQAGGLMVNYLSDLATVEANHRAYANDRTVGASAAVRALVPAQIRRSARSGSDSSAELCDSTIVSR